MLSLWKPWVFQGSSSRRRYFEGWYFKHVSAANDQVYSFIPGISLSKEMKHAFIQVINGLTGEVFYFEYPVNAFSASKRDLHIEIGDSSFSYDGIHVNLQDQNHNIRGEIHYSGMDLYPSKITNPGIMGWYSFVPFMECKHGVVSMNHRTDGNIIVNGSNIDFAKGKGYIEKDWGKSFPESWIWLHCNTFDSSESSFTFSVAKIPWLGSYFIGFISYLKVNGSLYNLSTWSGAKIESLNYDNKNLEIIIRSKEYQLEISAVNSGGGVLLAPVKGNMSRRIKETVDASISLLLQDKSGNLLFRDSGKRAGMELIDKMLSYFL